ncbi:beta strand repeat-containing protein [Verrucomicrobiota bacterium]
MERASDTRVSGFRSGGGCPRTARRLLIGACVATAAWMLSGAGAFALEIGGRTYDNADLGLGAGYSFAVVGGTNTHTFTGAGHTWAGNVTINTGARVKIVNGGTITRTVGDYAYTAGGVLEFNNTTFAHYGNNGIRGELEFRNSATFFLRERNGFNTIYMNDGATLLIDATSKIDVDTDVGGSGTYFGFRLGAGLTMLGGQINVLDGPLSFYGGVAVREAYGTINVSSNTSITLNVANQRCGMRSPGLTIQGDGNVYVTSGFYADGSAGGFVSWESTGATNSYSTGAATFTNGASWRIPSGVTVIKTAGSYLYGNGLLEVKGILSFEGASGFNTSNAEADGPDITVTNGGVLRMKYGTAGGYNVLYLDSDGTTLTVDSASKIEVDLGNATDKANVQLVGSGLDLNDGRIDIVKGILSLGGTPAALHDANGTISVSNGATMSFGTGGDKQRWGTTATGLTLEGAGETAIGGTITLDSSAGGFFSIGTTGANAIIGTTFYCNNSGVVNIPTGVNVRVTGSTYIDDYPGSAAPNCLFDVSGALQFDGGAWRLNAGTPNSASYEIKVNNGGTLKLTKNTFNLLWMGAGQVITLESGSLFNVTLDDMGQSVNFANSGGTMNIKDGATVEVTRGKFQNDGANIQLDGVDVPAGPGQTLSNGTYLITGNLDLNANIGANKFSTIGANAAVHFIGTNSIFDAIGTLNTVNGTLALENGKTNSVTAPAGGALTAGASGKLRFGLNAPDVKVPASTTNACLKISGTVVLTDNMTVEVVDSGGLAPGEYVIVSATTLTANVGTLQVTFPDGIPEGIRDGQLSREGDNLILKVRAPSGGTIIRIR